MMYSCELCVAIGCRCERCANNTDSCCIERNIECPDSKNFDPLYVCPGFKPRKEEMTDAAD